MLTTLESYHLQLCSVFCALPGTDFETRASFEHDYDCTSMTRPRLDYGESPCEKLDLNPVLVLKHSQNVTKVHSG